jgi:exosortase
MRLEARTALFFAYCAGVALVHMNVLHALYLYARRNETASHVVLVPFVTLVLIRLSRSPIFAASQVAWGRGLGLIVVGAGLSLGAWLASGSLTAEDALSLAVGGIVLQWLGGFLLFYGAEVFRAALFPLLFLAFTVPLPAIVLDPLILFLRSGSAHLVAGLFALTGTPYFREGFVFALPTVVIEIATECSGIRSSLALVLTSLIAGHLYLDRTWKKVVLVAVALPLTILKNGIRIVSLSLLSIHVNPGFLTGQLHHDGGIVFFLLTLAMLAPIFALLRRSGSAPVGIA